MPNTRTPHITCRIAVVLAVLGGLLTFAIHIHTRTVARPPEAITTTHVTCLAPNILAAIITDPAATTTAPSIAPAPEPGSIPAGFTPTRVVVCTELPPESTPAHTPAVLETIRDGDLTAVTTTLTQPSQPKSPFSLSDCTISLGRPAAIWLTDAHGNAIRPSIPTERSCGHMNPAPFTAINALPVTQRHIHPLDTH
ncbi:hypothetical protein [Rhodococcus erythropolis]|uniref:hypothetical protein n=1 Tax=Rhodococcus erythropolis TaxID=1833 RepID=UPI001BE76A0C|nr:hypothetical protein [Rhodococcus erythropolis]MBT2263551.1 hypothetical protein [Rhodococcus erythropolis]